MLCIYIRYLEFGSDVLDRFDHELETLHHVAGWCSAGKLGAKGALDVTCHVIHDSLLINYDKTSRSCVLSERFSKCLAAL